MKVKDFMYYFCQGNEALEIVDISDVKEVLYLSPNNIISGDYYDNHYLVSIELSEFNGSIIRLYIEKS